MKKSKFDPKNLPTFDQLINDVETNIENLETRELQIDQAPMIKEQTNMIIQQVALATQTEAPIVFTGFSLILQSGGYLKGVTNRRVKVADCEFSKAQFISAMKYIRCNYTLRTIARINRETILKIARKYNAPGNLYSQYKIYNPSILKASNEEQLEHSIYCTDFQRENPNTPQAVLEFLSKREVGRKEKKR